MLHLCECEVIREEYWNELIDLAVKTGMRPPNDITIFLATGALSHDRVINLEAPLDHLVPRTAVSVRGNRELKGREQND